MQRLLVILGLFLFSMNVQALDSCMTGSWYSPDRDGEGINIEVMADTELIYFYTYRNQKQVWYVVIDGAIYTTRKRSEEPFEVDSFDIGSAAIEVHDNDNITFVYKLDIDIDRNAAIPWCLTQCFGEYEYVRLTQPVACQ